MPDPTFIKRLSLPHSASEVEAWHARPGAFERLTPPWSGAEVVSRTGSIEPGSRVEIRMKAGPLRTRWLAEHREHDGEHGFVDVQLQGPFSHWEHTHDISSAAGGGSVLEDRIEYRLPLGGLGAGLGGRFVRRELDRTFDYRHRITADDMAAHANCEVPGAVAITGATGMVGSALTAYLSTGGHDVVQISRSRPRLDRPWVSWSADATAWNTAPLEGIDAVVHLAGENIAEGRWGEAKKKRIYESRVTGTEHLCRALAAADKRPRVLVCASAIGFYGDRGDELLTEQSDSADDFLADVCRGWEAATGPARDAGIRVVNLRIGVVLSAAGGALAKVALPFALGAGGVVGDGSQYMSWISLDDLLGVIEHAIANDALAGPLNAVSPQPLTNRDYTKTLGRVLRRPTVFPLPAFAARLAFGEMADALLLASTRVDGGKLVESGYRFRDPDIETALRHTLGRAAPVQATRGSAA